MNKDKLIGRVMAGCLRLHRYITLPPKARCAHRAIILCGALTALGPGNLAAAEWQPVKNVEIVVPASAGGSVDKTARFVQRLWQHHRLTEFTGIVVNKPGGAGTVALNYLNQHAGDAHFLEIVSATLLSQHITGQSALSHRDVTPLAQLFGEYYVLAVRPDSPFKTGRDVIAALNRDPKSLTIGIGSSLGGQSHASIMLPLKAAGVDIRRMKTVVFTGSGESMTALLGGHIDLVPAPSSTVAPQVASGKLRALAVTAPRRLGGVLAQVPTWKEQGVNTVLSNWRVVVGPRGMERRQIAYWESVFGKLVALPEWKQELDRNLWENTYMNSSDTKEFVESEYRDTRAILLELGLAK